MVTEADMGKEWHSLSVLHIESDVMKFKKFKVNPHKINKNKHRKRVRC